MVTTLSQLTLNGMLCRKLRSIHTFPKSTSKLLTIIQDFQLMPYKLHLKVLIPVQSKVTTTNPTP